LLASDTQEQEQNEVTVDEKDFESNDGFKFERGFQMIHLEKSQIEVGQFDLTQSKAEDIDLTHNYQIVTPGGDLDRSTSSANGEDDQDQAESFRISPKKLPNDNRCSQYFNKKTIPELDEDLGDSDIQAANMKYYQGVSMNESDSPQF
jgi:hypothetical protein